MTSECLYLHMHLFACISIVLGSPLSEGTCQSSIRAIIDWMKASS